MAAPGNGASVDQIWDQASPDQRGFSGSRRANDKHAGVGTHFVGQGGELRLSSKEDGCVFFCEGSRNAAVRRAALLNVPGLACLAPFAELLLLPRSSAKGLELMTRERLAV